MVEGKYFEDIRRMRKRLKGVKDADLVSLSARAVASVENILRISESAAQTAAYHTVAQKYENLDAALQRRNESMRFLDESQGAIKRDWEVLVATDVSGVKEALSALLSCCESLDRSDVVKRISSESQTLNEIVDEMEKIKSGDKKSCEVFAKLSNEFELSLKALDGVLGSTARPVSEFEEYSKFSSALEDLDERIGRLKESLKFFEDKSARGDWKYFMELDLKLLRESIKTSYSSSTQLIEAVTQE